MIWHRWHLIRAPVGHVRRLLLHRRLEARWLWTQERCIPRRLEGRALRACRDKAVEARIRRYEWLQQALVCWNWRKRATGCIGVHRLCGREHTGLLSLQRLAYGQ